MENKKTDKKILFVIVIVAIIALFLAAKAFLKKDDLIGIASGNGRLEATEIDIATKFAGRISEIYGKEGEFVKAGQLLATMQLDSFEAQLNEAEARLNEARSTKISAEAQVTARESDKKAAEAVVLQRQSELYAEERKLKRIEILVKQGARSEQDLDDQFANTNSLKAAIATAEAQVLAAQSAITAAKSEVNRSMSNINATQATVERVKADIKDSSLVAPVDGRIQYKVAQPGEVLAAGGNVLNMIDLSDVYMSFFLPTEAAGRLAAQADKGSEARIILDAASEFVIPARVTFVSAMAQFTPKTVETDDERLKLMFRVKAKIDPELLLKYKKYIKTGVTGNAYVKTDEKVDWPERLQIKLPVEEEPLSVIEKEYIEKKVANDDEYLEKNLANDEQ